MQIVIDIDEELYKAVIEKTQSGYTGSDVWIAVANGTPLPKGHGDLIDRDKLSHIYRQMSYCSTAPNFIWVGELMKVESVIKADKEVKNADSN